MKPLCWKFEPLTTFRWWDIEETNGKNVLRQYKKFSYFLFFPRRERSSGLDFLQASRGWKDAHSKFFDQKSVKFEGSRMLRYGDISDWKMKFLFSVIENFSVFYTFLHYRWWFFTYPDSAGQALALTSRPKNSKNFKFLSHIFSNFLNFF